MSSEAQATEPEQRTTTPGSQALKPLRAWIPAMLLALMIFARFVPGLVEDGPSMIWMVSAFGPFLLGVLIVGWWLLISRASWRERLVGALGIVAIFALVFALLDPTMVGPTIPVMTIPLGIGGFGLGAVLCSRWLSIQRTLVALLLCLAGAGLTTLLRNNGVWGNFAFGLDWRWQPSAEEQFLASKQVESSSIAISEENALNDTFASAQWPGFRGPQRDGAQRGTIISSDWSGSPPQELWRIRLGPAWSSFAVAEPFLFTQEQRAEEESVVCYDSASGQEVWAQSIPSRFFEGLGGLGPRATPTIAGDSIYAMGAEGWLMRLDAATGRLQWKTDLREVADCEPPMWGFSSSPLVVDDLVAVHTGAKEDKGIVALNASDGQLRWSVSSGQQSYSSLQLIEFEGEQWMAILTDRGAQLIDPSVGKTVLEHEWIHQGYRALQPQWVPERGLLIPTGMGTGTRLIQLNSDGQELASTEVWTSRNMKPDFNDLVVHEGFIYGFDDSIFACVDLRDGSRQWKRGRYGKGQVVLLADSDLLLVLSEKGEVVLLPADPQEHRELFKFQALDGKTWNHPVVVGDRLYIRNAQEAACYQLPLESADTDADGLTQLPLETRQE